MAVTADVVAWLTATLDEEEREARGEGASGAVATGPWHLESSGLIFGSLTSECDAGVCKVDVWPNLPGNSAHIIRHDPTHVLASVEADRQILALHPRVAHYSHTLGLTYQQQASGEHEPSCWFCEGCQCEDGMITGEWPCRTVLLVASRYRHRPGWQASWLT